MMWPWPCGLVNCFGLFCRIITAIFQVFRTVIAITIRFTVTLTEPWTRYYKVKEPFFCKSYSYFCSLSGHCTFWLLRLLFIQQRWKPFRGELKPLFVWLTLWIRLKFTSTNVSQAIQISKLCSWQEAANAKTVVQKPNDFSLIRNTAKKHWLRMINQYWIGGARLYIC